MKAKTEMLENGNLLMTIPMDLKDRGNGKTIAFDGEDADEAGRQAFLLAVARGRAWQRLVDDGRVSGIHELAQAIGHDHSYVSRIMRLATLSPRIIEAIVDGAEMPTTLNVARARKAIPLLWEEQEREFRTE